MRQTLALAALLLPAAALVPASAAEAAIPTCDGHRATIVGHQHSTVRGTAHRDVVVTNGADLVTTRGGDDLVCVTGDDASFFVHVSAGSGDDTVDVVSRSHRVIAQLGSGSDDYTGNGTGDEVYLDNDGHDTIHTRGGSDTVHVDGTGKSRADVDLGGGADTTYVGSARGSFRHLSGGGGDDRLVLSFDSGAAWTINTVQLDVRAHGEVKYTYDSFETFDTTFLNAPSITFVGGPAAETFASDDFEGHARAISASMGGGDDHVELGTLSSGTVDGGDGNDTVDVVSFADQAHGAVTADLATATATVTAQGTSTAWSIPGFENLTAHNFPSVALHGTDGPNTLTAQGSCTVSLDGRGGDDKLASLDPSGCEGGATPSSSADGGPGTDICQVDVPVACEGS